MVFRRIFTLSSFRLVKSCVLRRALILVRTGLSTKSLKWSANLNRPSSCHVANHPGTGYEKPPAIGTDLRLIVTSHPPLMSHADAEKDYLHLDGREAKTRYGEPYIGFMRGPIPFWPQTLGGQAGLFSMPKDTGYVTPLMLGYSKSYVTPIRAVELSPTLGMRMYTHIDMNTSNIKALGDPVNPYDGISASEPEVSAEGAWNAV